MTEDTRTEEDTNEELTALIERAKQMGIKHHPSIGLDTLKAKIEEHIAKSTPAVEEKSAEEEEELTAAQFRNKQRLEATKLIRVVVTCRNPLKQEHSGEYFRCGNAVVGTVGRMVPFNNTNGWHVERIILNMMEERMCQVFKTEKDAKGRKRRVGYQIPEFAITELPALTKDELTKLAEQQAITRSLED